MGHLSKSSVHRVVVLVRPRVLSFELSLVHRIFGQARSSEGTPLYEVVTSALEPGAVSTDADFSIHAAHGLEVLSTARTVVVPGSADDFDSDEFFLEPDIGMALGQLPSDVRIASICTGSFVLAAAGLLDGLKATTHWRSSKRFHALFPAVDLNPDVLYTDNGRILTSAGAAAGIDLCLHLVRRDHGAGVANDVARGTVVAPHRSGGQKQFIATPVPSNTVLSTSRARQWALQNLHREVTLRDLATQERTSTRTFTRRFRDETGTSPQRWLTQRRLERARELLERTDLPVDQVADESGFGSVESLRAHMRAETGISPSSYRSTFRG